MIKKAIVIGASSGIGKELSRILVCNGIIVGIAARRKKNLESLSLKHPGKIFFSALDCTKKNNREVLYGLEKKLGGLDLLVFASGTGDLNTNLSLFVEDYTNQLNVLGFTEIMNWAYHYFIKKNKGHIAVVTSIAGLRGGDASPAYNASKAFQINYLEGLRKKFRKQNKNITVLDIRPGFVDTAMAKGEGLFWVTSKERAASQIFYAIRKGAIITYISKRWLLVAIILKWLPARLYLHV